MRTRDVLVGTAVVVLGAAALAGGYLLLWLEPEPEAPPPREELAVPGEREVRIAEPGLFDVIFIARPHRGTDFTPPPSVEWSLEPRDDAPRPELLPAADGPTRTRLRVAEPGVYRLTARGTPGRLVLARH